MTKEEYENQTNQFERAMHFMIIASRERMFDDDDFKQLNWIVRNLDRLRNHCPSELTWDSDNKEILIK